MISEANLDFWIKNNYNVLFRGKHGIGKCLGKGTPVLMFDGSIKNVEDIKVNDLLMGPDSSNRKVISITSGTDDLYKITPTKGDSYIVNSAHILSLKMCSDYSGFEKNQIVNMNVVDFKNRSTQFRTRALGWRTGVDFADQSVPIDPYFIGLWLGDGASDSPQITTGDVEIVDYLQSFADNNKLTLKTYQEKSNCASYAINSGPAFPGCQKAGRNHLLSSMQELNLIDNKHIPQIYKSNSRKIRLELLAGIIDSDGSLSQNCFEIISKFDNLANDICFLARSLGFAAYTKPCKKGCWYNGEYKEGIYNRIIISGNIKEIPVKLDRKKPSDHLSNRDVLKTHLEVSSLGKGEYFGFEIDGDHLFMLGDFTVTHNTSIILNAFTKAGLRWKYFSASTMDSWVDFVGVPKERVDENGNSYLDLIRPHCFQNDEVDALFFDEFNRGSKKIRNSVMELIQFKSINGKKFNNLKIVWAAINPEDDEENKYDVEALDPAQMDRFHVITDIAYAPHVPYFRNKYGKEMADVAVTWWKELPKEQKDLVSPRRLDYTLDMHTKGGDLKFVLPNSVNTNKLIIELASGSISKKLDVFLAENNSADAKAFLNIENNYAACINYILKNKTNYDFFIPLLSQEKLVGLITKDKSIEKYIFDNHKTYQDIIYNIASAKSSAVSRRAAKFMKRMKIVPTLVSPGTNALANATINSGAPIAYAKNADPNAFIMDHAMERFNLTYSPARLKAYKWYEKNLPQNLTKEIAEEALKDLGTIVLNSQKSWTLDRKMKKMNGMLNHVISWYHANNMPVPLGPANTSAIKSKLDNFIL